jgi:hypothetical protein
MAKIIFKLQKNILYLHTNMTNYAFTHKMLIQCVIFHIGVKNPDLYYATTSIRGGVTVCL